MNPSEELKAGDSLTVNRRGEIRQATLIARAREREPLDLMIKEHEEKAGPSGKQETNTEPKDYTSSGTSWVPSNEGTLSEDSAKEERAKLESCRRQYSNKRPSKKVQAPPHRANAVIPKMQAGGQRVGGRKRPHNDTLKKQYIRKFQPDAKRKQKATTKRHIECQRVTVDVKELIKIKKRFLAIFEILKDLKNPDDKPKHADVPVICNAEEEKQSSDENKENENYASDEFNRSNDNVLITNKFNKKKTAPPPLTVPPPKNENLMEWVPIGSGKTLIHKDDFKKVNWRSYTIATRTLLLAAFPRRVLATHSLTGKRSPAFLDKPAKMCLDPKIVSDIILEIMDRFHVKANLVRNIITTKCADESKMWKTRMKKRKLKNEEKKSVTNNTDDVKTEEAAI